MQTTELLKSRSVQASNSQRFSGVRVSGVTDTMYSMSQDTLPDAGIE